MGLYIDQEGKSMIIGIYTIYDKVAEEAGQLFHAKNEALAVRQFGNLVGRSMSPSDYELLHVGEFDNEAVRITTLKENKVVNTPFKYGKGDFAPQEQQ